jgi:hypothetical protein
MTRRDLARFRASARRSLGVFLLTAALGPAPLAAQVPPPEQPPSSFPPPDDTPIAGGHPIAGSVPSPLKLAAGRSANSLWNVVLQAGESWERNPMFRPGETEASFADRLQARVDYLRTTPRARFSAALGGTGIRYHSFEDLDHLGGNASLGLAYNLSPKAMISLNDTFESRWARDSTLLVDSGLYYDTVRTLTNRATGQFRLRATERTSAAVEVRHEYVDFDSDTLLDGTQIAATGSLNRRIAPEQTLGISYSYASSNSSGTTRSTNHTVFGSWAGTFGLHWGLAGSGGAIRAASGQWRPYAAAELTGEFRRTALHARASHSVSQAYGFGREREATILNAGVRQQVGRRLLASIGVGYDRSREVGSDLPPFTGINANGALSFTLSRHFFLGLDALHRLRRSTGPDTPETSASRVGLQLIYERTPR